MAKFEIIMPKMGESITEATITKWLKNINDSIKEDEPIVEIATDKVDSEIPSPVDGVIVKQFYKEGDVVEVGKIIAIIATDGENIEDTPDETPKVAAKNDEDVVQESKTDTSAEIDIEKNTRFYSPLVKKMAKEENISPVELDSIKGSGKDGRPTKNDILEFIEKRNATPQQTPTQSTPKTLGFNADTSQGNQIIEMDRMRQLIAQHMLASVQTSAHVTSFAEADMTNIVRWRDANKQAFLKNNNEKLTYTHIILHTVAKALKEFPIINASVNGNQIILKKNINIGMATALPNGNLIVPVIKNIDEKNLLGIIKSVNDLAVRARENKLLPDEIQDGTFTITNLGSFNTLTGTPIINQPQVAILSMGIIKKRPVVLETDDGDVIAIRHMMYLSLTYDHRIVDGAMGGMFLDKVVNYLEKYESEG